MALRIRSKWRNRAGTLEDNAGALAYAIWQISLNGAKNLHTEHFDYRDDEQRIAVITEYLCFLVHVADRVVYSSMDANTRQRFIVTLANQTARHLQRNKEDIMGHRDYRHDFIDLFNQRATEYATTSFSGNGPGFAMLRSFGQHIQTLMGSGQTNRWVIDQIMMIDAEPAVAQMRRALDDLFATSIKNPATNASSLGREGNK